MSYQEKRSLVSLFSTILSFSVYCLYVYQGNQESDLSRDFKFWGSFILFLIPVQILFNIVLHILFVMINFLFTGEEDPTVTDERDQLIDLKSLRNFYHVFMLGFAFSMAMLAMDQSPDAMFKVLIGAILVAGITGNLSQFYFYRRGV